MIAVGGCYAEAQRERLFALYPYVDVAFGPGLDPASRRVARRGRLRRRARRVRDRRRAALRGDAADAPRARASRRGCRSRWAATRSARTASSRPCAAARCRGGPARSSPRSTRLARRACARSRCSARTSTRGRDLPELRTEFGELLRACDAVDGIERIRFTRPHPKDFRAPVIEAMAECAAVCEHTHLPLQSGSTRILKAMRRTYSRERYLRLVDELRAAIPDLALTTDIIVGFPGETEDDFRETLEVVEEVGFDGAFTFVYSPRQGTEAAAMPGPGPGRGEARADRAARRGRAAGRAASATASASDASRRCSSRAVAHRPGAAARPHAPQHDRQLRRRRAQPGELVDVLIEARRRRRCAATQPRCRCCVAATSTGTAASTSATSAATAPRTAARRATAPSCAPTASAS